MGTFLPPHCPNPTCAFHCSSEGWPFCKAGFHYRLRCSPTRIQRFRCLHCSRSFSTQTFSTTYWLHKPDLLTRVFQRSLACSGFRQIASELGVSHTTIMNQAARLGRHCLLFQNNHRPQPCEPLVIDGFESFEYSQYFPFHFNVLVGKHSHFFYSFTESPLRRKGAMTAHQKKRRESLELRLGRPDPKAIERGVEDLLRSSVSPGNQITLHSDEHPAYPRALRRLPPNSVCHVTTSSTERRTPNNPLFPANLLDLLIRHGGANHKRETIAFSKRRQGAIERLAILQVWRNFMKSFSERKRDASPAQRLGLMERKLQVSELLKERLFPGRCSLSPTTAGFYWRHVRTATLENNRMHELKYAC